MTTMTHTETGALRRLTVEHLAEAGVSVSPHGDADDGQVRIAGDGAVWLLTVTDRGEADLTRWPADAGHQEPRRLADLATILLTGRPVPATTPAAVPPPELRVNGIAGMDLRDRGFTVELNVYSDRVCFDVLSEIQATNPPGTNADPHAVVGIADNGILSWYRNYRLDHAVIEPATIAEEITAAIAPALMTI